MLKSCLLKPIGAASHLLIFKTIYPFEPLESEIEVLWYDKEKRSTYGLKYITEASSIFSLWFQNYLSPHCTHAKSLQSCPTLWDPMDCSPPGFSVHGDSLGKNTGVVCHFLLQWIFLTQRWNQSLLSLALAGGFLTTKRHLGSPSPH